MRLIVIIFFLVILAVPSFSQTEYVSTENRVYDFLERMETLQIISDYNAFEIPKTRLEISEYLKRIVNYESLLDEADKDFFADLKIEFEYELYGTLMASQKLIDGEGYDFLSQKQKYLYYYNDSHKLNLFVNLSAEGSLLWKNDLKNNYRPSAFPGVIGGEIRGTVLDKFGLFLKGTDGNVFGSRDAAYLKPDLRYNYKFNEKPGEGFFDETEGYITADFNLIRFKYGRDRMNIGYGPAKIILGNIAPEFDYLGMNIKYGFFSYSFFHGQLLGRESYDLDSITGGSHIVESKYMAYHRIAFDLSKHFNMGAGEIVVYGGRPVDLSYLNPFSFYKSIEHSNRDRDNAMLFFDANNKSIQGLKFYVSLLIDDVSFGKLGTGWWGNQTIFNAGLNCELLYDLVPLGLKLEYTRIDPYVYTHRLIRNNYTSYGYGLSSFSEPNSELFLTEINYRFNGRLGVSLLFNYKIHGANPLDSDGSVIQNVGGDINLGHRTFDSEHLTLLDGFKEYSRFCSLVTTYEPVNQYFVTFSLNYLNETLQTNNSELLNLIWMVSIKI